LATELEVTLEAQGHPEVDVDVSSQVEAAEALSLASGWKDDASAALAPGRTGQGCHAQEYKR
jgi:hypothetical protein